MKRPAELARLSRRIYRGGPVVPRTMQHLRPFICPFERLLEFVPPAARMLDAGCGCGLFLGLALSADPRATAIGCDAGARAIGMAQRMSELAGIAARVRFEERDITASLPEGRFDMVSMIDVMHHIPQAGREELLASAIARVRPGGVFLYKDMAMRPRWMALANQLHDRVFAREWIRYSPLDEIERWATARGCKLVARESIHRLWYAHELLVFLTPE